MLLPMVLHNVVCSCKWNCHFVRLLCLCDCTLKMCTALSAHCIAPRPFLIHNRKLPNVAPCAPVCTVHCCTLWIVPVLLAYATACGLQTQPGSQHLSAAASLPIPSLLRLPCQHRMLYLCSADASVNNSTSLPLPEMVVRMESSLCSLPLPPPGLNLRESSTLLPLLNVRTAI